MGTEVNSSHYSHHDFQRFQQRLRDETLQLAEWFETRQFSESAPVGGYELEAWLIDSNARPAPVNDRFLEMCDDALVVPELAKFNVEFNGHPQVLADDALKVMEDELAATWRRSDTVAARLGAALLMIGTLPTAREGDLHLGNMSNMTRYRALNEQVLRLRHGRPLSLDIRGKRRLRIAHRDVMLESAATSFQLHMQVEPRLAARLYNAAHIVSAPIVAACANSPYLFGSDLWDETRVPLFEQAVALTSAAVSHCGTVSRVTFGSGYVKESMFECYQENLDCYPVLLPDCNDEDPATLPHLRLHNGTIWRWNRPLIGFDDQRRPHLRIEHRVVPAGPSITDTFANAALFFGLVYMIGRNEPAAESRIEFTTVRENFYTAARLGLRARIVWLDGKRLSIRTLLRDHLIPLAREGLAQLGLDRAQADHYLQIVDRRVATNRNGAAWQRAYVAKHHADMQELTLAYMERQHSGAPVHEWSL